MNRPNYFKSEEGKKSAIYKLWMAIKPEYMMKWKGRKKMVFFGYNKRRENGLDWLIEKAKKHRDEIVVAHIYNNQTGERIYKIPGTVKGVKFSEDEQ